LHTKIAIYFEEEKWENDFSFLPHKHNQKKILILFPNNAKHNPSFLEQNTLPQFICIEREWQLWKFNIYQISCHNLIFVFNS
jgi:hypothetical protein